MKILKVHKKIIIELLGRAVTISFGFFMIIGIAAVMYVYQYTGIVWVVVPSSLLAVLSMLGDIDKFIESKWRKHFKKEAMVT